MLQEPSDWWVRIAKYSRDGRRILTASSDGTARLWNAENGRPLVVFEGHTEPVASAEFFPGGRRIATLSLDNTVRICNAESGQLVSVLHGSSDRFAGSMFFVNDRHIITTDQSEITQLWRQRRPEPLYGVLLLPECWLTVILAAGLAWSLRRDRRAA
jgi:WD40 repeat protein